MADLNNITPMKGLPPFLQYFRTVGIIPASYKVTMTFEEQVLELMRFIRDEIIPKINENVLATSELQEKFKQLVTYVDEYFENLDIQEEVNVKLNEMAESGELAELISQYLESQAIIGFNTVNNLANAENLANGSFAKTYGKLTYNDGKGAFYKIRTRTNADVPDDYNIIVLINTQNLIAERIINEIETDVYNLQNNLYSNKFNIINSDKAILIGDSYGVGYTPDGNVESWTTKLSNKLGIQTQSFSSNGAGFVATGSGGKTFLTLLQENINNITNKNNVKLIIVGGGYNDANYSSNYNDMITAINNFNVYCKENFPYAKIYIACFGYNCNKTGVGADVRDKLIRNVIPAYKSTPQEDVFYIKGSNLILHNSDLFSSDGFHPNENGQLTIANKIYEGIFGTINLSFPHSVLRTIMTNGIINNSSNFDLDVDILDDDVRIWLQENVNIAFNPGISITGNQNYELGTYQNKHLSVSRNTTLRFPIKCLLVSTTQGNNLRDGVLIFTTDGKVYLQVKQIANNSWETVSNITQISIYATGIYTKLSFN